MNTQRSYIISILLFILLSAWVILPSGWITEKHKNYTFLYQKADEANKAAYIGFIENGIKKVNAFFDGPYKHDFDIYVHPSRQSLDSQWQKDWKMPSFKSECWMVASGVANKLDMISPMVWDVQACEHSFSDKEATQQVITHELFHVYHGQYNVSGNFDNMDTLDWFVEGLASYASGQYNEQKKMEIKNLVVSGKAPALLNDFWKGKLRYPLSGSLVMFIDVTYGRKKLKELLQYNKNSTLLASLHTTEEELLKAWRNYVEQ